LGILKLELATPEAVFPMVQVLAPLHAPPIPLHIVAFNGPGGFAP
jgi:hypothetical protein